MKTMKLATKIFLAVIGVLLAAAGIVCLADPMGAVTTVAWVVGLVLLSMLLPLMGVLSAM